MKAGDFFGENVAMGYADRRNASAKALNEVTTLVISPKELGTLPEDADPAPSTSLSHEEKGGG